MFWIVSLLPGRRYHLCSAGGLLHDPCTHEFGWWGAAPAPARPARGENRGGKHGDNSTDDSIADPEQPLVIPVSRPRTNGGAHTKRPLG